MYARLTNHLELHQAANMRNIIRLMINGTSIGPTEPIIVPIGPVKQNVIREKVIDPTAVTARPLLRWRETVNTFGMHESFLRR